MVPRITINGRAGDRFTYTDEQGTERIKDLDAIKKVREIKKELSKEDVARVTFELTCSQGGWTIEIVGPPEVLKKIVDNMT